MNATNMIVSTRIDNEVELKNSWLRATRVSGVIVAAVIGSLIATSLAYAEPFAYVTNQDSNTVSVIDTASNTVTATVPVGSTPSSVAITPDGAGAYVTNTNSTT